MSCLHWIQHWKTRIWCQQEEARERETFSLWRWLKTSPCQYLRKQSFDKVRQGMRGRLNKRRFYFYLNLNALTFHCTLIRSSFVAVSQELLFTKSSLGFGRMKMCGRRSISLQIQLVLMLSMNQVFNFFVLLLSQLENRDLFNEA